MLVFLVFTVGVLSGRGLHTFILIVSADTAKAQVVPKDNVIRQGVN